MNPYTTKTEARIRQSDISALVDTNSDLAGASIAALERQRGCLAEAEMHRLLKQHGVTPYPSTPRIAMLRQTIGAAPHWSGS